MILIIRKEKFIIIQKFPQCVFVLIVSFRLIPIYVNNAIIPVFNVQIKIISTALNVLIINHIIEI